MIKWLALILFSLFIMGCIDVSDFLEEKAKEVFPEDVNVTVPNYTQVENVTENVTIETSQPEEPKSNKTEKDVSEEEFVCPPEYEDVYITKVYDPYYCTINMAAATRNITLCETIPLDAKESLDRCIRVIATTYGKDPKWCEDNLYRNESIEMCRRFVMFGHKRETY